MKAKARVWEKANDVQRAVAEAAANIRVKAEDKRAKRDMAKSEARAKAEAEIK